MQSDVTAICRVQKIDSYHIALARGAQIVIRSEEVREDDVGTGVGLLEVKKIRDNYFPFITECTEPKAHTICFGAGEGRAAERFFGGRRQPPGCHARVPQCSPGLSAGARGLGL